MLRKRVKKFLMVLLLALMMPLAVMAQSLEQAASQAARKYDAKVLSAQTVNEGGRKVHVIKLLTKKGVVKTVRIPVREN